jgi:signal recognition particle subunit SRP19
MPTVEDYFDDETDLPLPSASGSGSGSSSKSKPRTLQGQGLQGALLEEISTEDPSDDFGFDYSRMAEQGRGIFGENSIAPPPGQDTGGKGKVAVRDNEQRPTGPDPNTPMGGFMGDMMRMQQVEEERLEKLRKQFGSTTIAKDPSVYKE